jgi:hypothetical protein
MARPARLPPRRAAVFTLLAVWSGIGFTAKPVASVFVLQQGSQNRMLVFLGTATIALCNKDLPYLFFLS